MIDLTTTLENRSRWQRLSRLALGSLLLAGGWLAGLAIVWEGGPTAGFLAGVAATLALEFVIVAWVSSRTEGVLEESVTGATWITIARGSGLGILGGFLVVGVPANGDVWQLAAWLPGVLFALVAVLDAVDGPVARATDSVTHLGDRLDTEIDALTVLVGSTIVVASGLAPVFFLAAGLARYAFVAGIAGRRIRGAPVDDLDDNRIRSVLGALVFCAIWLALLPIPGTSVSRTLSTIILFPFLAHFLRDWLVVSRRYQPR